MRTFVIAGLLALTLAGCGESNPASKAFDGITASDMETLRAFSTQYQGIGEGLQKANAALENENLDGARSGLEEITPKLDAADDKVLDVDSSALRKTLQDYMLKTRRVIAAVDRWVGYFEDESTPRDQALEDTMLTEIQTSNTEMQKADQALLNRILDNATPEQRKQIREAVRGALDETS
jgi:hypothetical protein